jgi:lysophospholipase L1-like esterase
MNVDEKTPLSGNLNRADLLFIVADKSLSDTPAGNRQQVVKGTDLFNATTAPSFLAGKTVFVIGDSFVQGNMIQGQLAPRLGVNVVSEGVSGSCIARGFENALNDGSLKVAIVDRIDAALTTNPDIIIIEGLSNDSYFGAPLGDIHSTDKATVYGALKYIAAQCASHNPPVQAIFFTPIIRGNGRADGSTNDRNSYAYQEAYANAMIEVGRLYSIPVCDVFHGSGITFENLQYLTADGIHPNAVGQYRLGNILASFILNPITAYYAPPQIITEPTQPSEQPVVWGSLVGNTTYTNGVLSVSSGSGGWINGATGTKTVQSGNISLKVPAINANAFIIGLSGQPVTDQPIGANFQTIRHGLYVDNTSVKVFENGGGVHEMNKTYGTQVSLRIDVIGNNVKYYVNDEEFYTSTLSVAYPLMPVASISFNDGTPINISGVTLS